MVDRDELTGGSRRKGDLILEPGRSSSYGEEPVTTPVRVFSLKNVVCARFYILSGGSLFSKMSTWRSSRPAKYL